jgi:hypothetical protein
MGDYIMPSQLHLLQIKMSYEEVIMNNGWRNIYGSGSS